MALRRAVSRRWSTHLVVVAHAAALAIATAVPLFALGDALHALWTHAEPEALTQLRDARRWLVLLGNTGVVTGVALVVSLGLGTVLGMLVGRTDLPARRGLLAALLLAACVPVYISAVALFAWVPARLISDSALICGMLYGAAYTPLAALILVFAFQGVDRDLEEHALLHANPASVLRHVTVPHAAWGYVAAATLVLLLTATDFTLTDLLGVRTFAEEVYTQFMLDRRHAGPVLTAVPVLAALGIALFVVQRQFRLLGEQATEHAGAAPRIFALGRRRAPLGFACCLVVTFGVVFSIGRLCTYLTPVNELAKPAAAMQREVWITLVLAAAAALLIVVPAAGLAWTLARGRPGRWLVASALVLLLASPAPVIGISLIRLLNRPGLTGWLYDSPLVITLGYFVRFLPVGILLLIPGMRRIPREIEDTARVDGCGWLRTHWHIRRPALHGDLAVVGLVLLILCVGELGTTNLVAPPGCDTISKRAFQLLHSGVYRDLALLALLAIGAILLPWLGLLWFARRMEMRTHRAALEATR